MRNQIVPDIVIRRLPLYLRTLRELYHQGMTAISSEELARELGITAAQIRRDFSYFGRFGKQGLGYPIPSLIQELEAVLHLDRTWTVALVGYGNLGQAIAHHRGFEENGFHITAIFAKNPEHIGQVVNGVVVLPETEIERVVREMGIRLGIIAVPAAAAQEVADRLIAGGVKALLTYAPAVLRVPPGVVVRSIDPVTLLQSMTFYVDDTQFSKDNGHSDIRNEVTITLEKRHLAKQ